MANTGVELREVRAGTISIHGVTVGASEEELVAALERRGLLAGAELAGLQRRTIITLAQRLKPAERLDFEQAVTELEHAVEVALDVIARGERGTNDDAFVNTVLARVAERVRSDDLDGGAQAIDAALAEIDAQYRRSQTTLLEEGIKVDTLRRDAAAVARRIEMLVAVDHPTDRPAWRSEFRERLDAFSPTARCGASISRCRSRSNWRGGCSPRHAMAMSAGPLRFCSASPCGSSASARAARRGWRRRSSPIARRWTERTRERMSLQWATTQNNLGTTLRSLGERESGTARLEEAVAAYRAALTERTRERVPLDWAMTQNNLGNALGSLGERENGTARLEEAVAAFRGALRNGRASACRSIGR